MRRVLLLRAAIVAALVLAAAAPARADLLELTYGVEGYYRARAVMIRNLAPQDDYRLIYPVTGEEVLVPEIKRTSYLTHRLRVLPQVRYGDLAKLTVQVDALDDVLWGDNNGVSSAPLFATDVSNQNYLGGEEQSSIEVSRAWLEFNAKLGVMRVGRMPSHWGMGLLANGGGSAWMDPDPARPAAVPQRKSLDNFFDDDFGDNHFGSTADRVIFLTKPLTVYKTIRKQSDTSSKLILGYGYSVITEAPLLAAEPFERKFRPFGQQGFIGPGGRRDDIDEHILVAVWNDPYWQPGGRFARDTDELRVGFYGVMRRSRMGSTNPSDIEPGELCGTFEGDDVACKDTGSKVWIADFWYRLKYGPIYSEAEALKIGGTTFGGVPFPFRNTKKKADIDGAVVRLGFVNRDPSVDPLRMLVGAEPYERDLWELEVEGGHASGDDRLEDESFKQRALHPDYNVGLVLFEETLRELSARTFGPFFFSDDNPDGAKGLFSNGGVINSNYVMPKVRYHLPWGDTKLVAGLLMAWVDTLADSSPALFSSAETDSTYLGTEADVAFKAHFNGHMDLSIEGGYLWYGDALKSELPNADHSYSLQSRLAFIW